MGDFAVLECVFHQVGESEYSVRFRFEQPERLQALQVGQPGLGQFHLNLTEQAKLTHDRAAYARALTSSFFKIESVQSNSIESNSIWQAFEKAYQSASDYRLPLCVRMEFEDAKALHSVYWEMLQDPYHHSPLFAGENRFFSRFINSRKPRQARLPDRNELSAFVFVANPTDLESYGLDPIDKDNEYEQVSRGLGRIAVEQDRDSPATLDRLRGTLSDRQPAILYLACHGRLKDDEPSLWLERDDGCTDRIAGSILIGEIERLQDPPLLIVLASCQSGGPGTAGDPLAPLGPRLVDAGVPAVVAMQGNVSMETVAEFVPVLFREFAKDCQVERAVAVARGAVSRRSDSWMPILFTSMVSGRLCAEPRPRPFAWLAAALLVLVLAAGGWWQFGRVDPLDDFGIAVAEFGVVDGNGQPHHTWEGLEISQGIYTAIQDSLDQSQMPFRENHRGPGQVGIIRGADPDARAARAGEVARRWNATILVYGVIRTAGSGYQVEPAFYINEQVNEQQLGAELDVSSAALLGEPIPIDYDFSPGQVFLLNDRLKARVDILGTLVVGLYHFYLNQYNLAASSFKEILYLPGWPEDQGKEVIYLLQGAAYLREYDPSDPDQTLVRLAGQAFEQASSANPDYARAHIGLGTVALAQATKDNPLRGEFLFAARDSLQTALKKPDPSGAGYVAVKAHYELAEVNLLGAEYGVPTFSAEQARTFYNQVLDRFKEAGEPYQLRWYAANSHLMLGRLYGGQGDWEQMRRESVLALHELGKMNQKSPSIRIAVAQVNFHIGWADEQLGNIELADREYRLAIETIGDLAQPDLLAEWQEQLDKLDMKKEGTIAP